MADTGAPHFIPYVEPTDLVREYPAADEAQAFAVAAGLTAAGNAGIGSNVVQAVKTDTFSTSSATFLDVPDLTAAITPTSEDSKILVFAYTPLSNSSVGNGVGAHIRIMRGDSPVFIGDAEGLRTQASGGYQGQPNNTQPIVHSYTPVFVDNPNTDLEVTYKVQMRTASTTAAHLGRSGFDTDSESGPRIPSSLVLIEVAP